MNVSLNDKFDLSKDRIFVSGSQAVVRMLLMQRELDRRAGLDTAGFISGYRGSPLGGLDQQLWKARRDLERSNIVFPARHQRGARRHRLLGFSADRNCWARAGTTGCSPSGTARVRASTRSGDVFRHANLAGTSPHGGVLALMGDDHTAESSTNAHATEFLFVDTMIPIFHPAGVQELIDYGLYGYALVAFRRHLVGDQMRQGQHPNRPPPSTSRSTG